jgi:branched-chain amino acid transport system permease protein
VDLTIFLQLIISGLLIGLVFSLIAVGLTLIWGVMDILNFAHGDFLMLAMFTSFMMFDHFGLDPLFSLPMIVVLLFFIGLLTFRLVIKPVLGYPGLIALLATFGLSILIRNLVLFFLGPNYRVIYFCPNQNSDGPCAPRHWTRTRPYSWESIPTGCSR